MAEFWSQCVGFLSNLWSQFISLVSSFSISSMLDVLLISFIIFSFIKLVRETRAEQLVKGIFLLLGVWLVANVLQLRMMQSILNYFFNFSVIALLVVFQPEVRRALEQAYNEFDNVTDPLLMEACIYEINALRAKYNCAVHDLKNLTQ